LDNPEFIEKLKKGDKRTFNELVENYATKVLNTCYRFFPVREDAEDISQEVFIEIYKSIKSFRGEAKLSTWIYRITITKCLDEIKKRKRKKRITSIGKMLHLDEIAGWLSGGALSDKSIHEKEKMEEVMTALSTLPDNQRVAFTLSKIDGYTNKEIAEIMNTTIVAVESLVSHAKKKISAKLEFILKSNN
jgi:RNA polymerase sigma-70 factor, ECF subfamily